MDCLASWVSSSFSSSELCFSTDASAKPAGRQSQTRAENITGCAVESNAKMVRRESVLEITATFFFQFRHQSGVDDLLRFQRTRRSGHQSGHLYTKLDAFDF